MINSENYPKAGKVEWIGLRPAKRFDVKEVSNASIKIDQGLEGDHYSGKSGKRHITLIQAEHLPVINSLVDSKEVKPNMLRRNIVVSGINLLSLKDKQFAIGDDVILETTGDCHPCSRMEENLGYGGWNAMRGMGGITARVVRGGSIKVGDKVTFVPSPTPLD